MAARRAGDTTSAKTAPTPAEQLPDLPEAAVACILQHLSLRERLTRCALVCRAWAAAAAAVPADVDIELKSSERCGQLQDWLVKHGGVVVRLRAKGDECLPWRDWRPLQLPVLQLTQLRSLDLKRLRVQLPAQGVTTRSSARRRRGSALTGGSCSSAGNSTGSAAAVVLPQLQELKLRNCKLTLQLASRLLGSTALTNLRWDYVYLHSDSWTRQIEQVPGQDSEYATMWQRLQLLPKLSDLQLLDFLTAPADIAAFSTLQHLQRLSLRLLIHLANHRELGPRPLLSALQHLTQLRHLKLEDCGLWKAARQPQQQGDSGYQCFSALTASTQLTALELLDLLEPVPVPQAAFEHMFPPGRVLPHLKVLHIEGPDWLNDQRCVEAAQVARIAASCPALQELELRGVTHWFFDVSCLSQLPAAVTRVEGLNWFRPAA